jgi:hypothetical protein
MSCKALNTLLARHAGIRTRHPGRSLPWRPSWGTRQIAAAAVAELLRRKPGTRELRRRRTVSRATRLSSSATWTGSASRITRLSNQYRCRPAIALPALRAPMRKVIGQTARGGRSVESRRPSTCNRQASSARPMPCAQQCARQVSDRPSEARGEASSARGRVRADDMTRSDMWFFCPCCRGSYGSEPTGLEDDEVFRRRRVLLTHCLRCGR